MGIDLRETWSDEEIARRWCRLCPAKKCSDRSSYEPSPTEIAMIVNCPERLTEVRLRLSDISWWMRILCQKIAIRANDEALSAPSDLPVATRHHLAKW